MVHKHNVLVNAGGLWNRLFAAVASEHPDVATDYLHVEKPETVIPLIGIISLAGILLATVVSGPLSDKLGRRKIFG